MDNLVEGYLELAGKYLAEAGAMLGKGDYVQASEKLWGAVAETVKALAASEGRLPRTHRHLWEYLDELASRLGEPELRRLFSSANTLHQNFYENMLPPETVKQFASDCRKLISRLKHITNPSP